MKITVRKSPPVIVRPSEPPPPTRDTEKLSSLDKPYVKLLVTSFLVLEHPIHDAAGTIKRALSRALVHYYPFAGQIIATGDGEFHVQCHGEGAVFVAATANCALKDAIKLFDLPNNGESTRTLLNELAVYYSAAEGCGPTDPLLLMQVTEFSCGGFVLGVTWDHGMADGAGLAQFLQAVGELARGSPSPSVVPPVRWDASLPSIPPSVLQLVGSSEPLHLAFLGVIIPLSSINRIKASFRDRSDDGQKTCTTFEAVAAVLWQCRTRAIVSDPGSMALLFFAVNVRKHVGAKDGYYGNCIVVQHVTASSGAVASADIVDLVKMIKRAKDEAVQPDQLLLNKKEGLYEMIRAMDKQHLDQLRYNTLGLSSWRNIGFEDADFGGGTPARVMYYTSSPQALPICVSLPCTGKDAPSSVFSVCVKEEHADAFVAQLARLNT